MSTKIYLDYNSTCPVRPAVRKATSEAMAFPYNASSVHSAGREGRKMIEHARAEIANLTGAPTSQVIFNSGATEGNNTVIRHFAGERILTSTIEHPSVFDAAPDAQRIPVDTNGVVDLDALENLLKHDGKTGLMSVMLVNNETGVIQPIKEIAELAHSHGALFHCDAVQAAGRIPIDIAELGADFLTLSAHKIGGPQGVGALVLGLCGVTPVLLHGGGQEKKARAGTENVAGIAGFGEAAKHALAELPSYTETFGALRKKLEMRLKEITPDIVIYGENTPRIPNTSFFGLPGAKSETLLMALDLEGIAVSNGSACSSGTVKASPVLKAMGYDDTHASGAIRVSMGWNTSPEDIDVFLQTWEKIIRRIKL